MGNLLRLSLGPSRPPLSVLSSHLLNRPAMLTFLKESFSQNHLVFRYASIYEMGMLYWYIDILIYWYIDMYGKIAKIKDVIGCTHGLRGKALQHSFHETWCRVQRCCAATISFSLPESESEMKQLLFCRNESGALCNYFFLLFIFTPNQFFFSLQLSTILAVHCATISFLFSLSLFTQSNDFFPALSLSPQTIISSFNSTFQDNNKRTNNSVLPYTMYFFKEKKISPRVRNPFLNSLTIWSSKNQIAENSQRWEKSIILPHIVSFSKNLLLLFFFLQ